MRAGPGRCRLGMVAIVVLTLANPRGCGPWPRRFRFPPQPAALRKPPGEPYRGSMRGRRRVWRCYVPHR